MRNREAFTLIELLIVVAIIALLVSILLPTLQKAREETKVVICMSNLRNINLALEYYANDWDDAQPITRANGPDQPSPPGPPDYIGWVAYLTLGGYVPDHKMHPEAVMVEKTGSNSIFFCPDKLQIGMGEKCAFWPRAVSHYGHTQLAGEAVLGSSGVSPWADQVTKFGKNRRNGQYGPYKTSEIRSPADTLRVAEGSWWWHDVGGNPPDNRFQDFLLGDFLGSPGCFWVESTYPAIEWRTHMQSSPLGFFDSHVERFSHGSLNDWKGRVPQKWFVQH